MKSATEAAVETHALSLGWTLDLDVWSSLGRRNPI